MSASCRVSLASVGRGGARHADTERRWAASPYAETVRLLSAVVGLAIFALGAEATPAPAKTRVHLVTLATPAQFDFAIATITPSGPTRGLRISLLGEPSELAVAAAVARAKRYRPPNTPRAILMPPLDPHPGRTFVVIVNRQPRGSTQPAPASVELQLQSRVPEGAPTVSLSLDVLADGAPGADCSMLHYFPGDPRFGPGAWSFANPFVVLRSLLAWAPDDGTAEVGNALDLACHGVGGEGFGRWVRQEPPPVHP